MKTDRVPPLAVLVSLVLSSLAQAQVPAQVADKEGPAENVSDVTISSHILQHRQLPAPPVTALKVPEGFRVTKFAESVGNVRMLVVATDGTVYATRREEADVLMFKVGSNGSALAPVRVASRAGLHGIALHGGRVYLATVHEIYRADVLPDGRFGPLEMLLHDLPDAGQHNTRTVQIGPDDMMYVSVGSTCNECVESSPESAAMLRGSLDGKRRAVFASGLRDTIGWAWHPVTGDLWGMDHGIDYWGDEIPPEELNRIEKGKRYGWPYLYGNNVLSQRLYPPGGLLRSEWRQKSVPMALGYTAHGAPMQMAFYAGAQFPAEYRNDAFVSFHGSWNRKPSSGFEVARVRFKDGQPQKFEPFVTGFLTDKGVLGRPCGTAVATDGSLLIGDDLNGVIYRISYAGKAGGTTTEKGAAAKASPPATAALQQADKAAVVPLAIKRPETATTGKLTVTSPAFRQGAAIPAAFSAYEQDNSFPIAWTAAPAGTQSYALIMEDPDSQKPPIPVVHWIAWNIPGTTLGLREGLPKQDRLEDPAGLRQGPSTSGQVGYKGPRPPAGDPAHHYHVQIFALDRLVDLPTGSDRDELLAALKGHVLASGALVGTFKRPDRPAKP